MSIDTENSTVEWVGTKITTYHNGILLIKSGNVQVSDGNLSGGTVVLDMPSLVATDEDMGADSRQNLTDHLRSDDFFDVENHPEAIFDIAAVKPFSKTDVTADESAYAEISEYKIADPTHMIEGNLTIKGITKGIIFPARIEVKENEVVARAKFNFNRMEWDLKYPGMKDDAINEMIHLGFMVIAKYTSK